jgi:hypothetical protein
MLVLLMGGMKYTIDMGSGTIIQILNFIKNGSKIVGRGDISKAYYNFFFRISKLY